MESLKKNLEKSAQNLAWRGISHFEENDYKSAEKNLNSAIKKGGASLSWALLPRSACRLAQGRFAPALGDLGAYLNLFPKFPGQDAAKRLVQGALKGFLLERGWPEIPIEPQVKWFWKNAAAKDYWTERVKKASELYATMEYATVREGVRRAMFYNFPAERHPFEIQARQDGLFCQTLLRVKKYVSFAHHHTLASDDDPEAYRYAIIAKDPKDIQEVQALYGDKRDLDARGHVRIGELLGYPPCCVRFFKKMWLQEKKWDPVFEEATHSPSSVLLNSRKGVIETVKVKGHPWCNTLLRYNSVRAISWLPCSFECRSSVSKAKEWIAAGQEFSRDCRALDDLTEILSQPLSWICAGGLALIEGPNFRIIGNSFFAPRLTQVHWCPRRPSP